MKVGGSSVKDCVSRILKKLLSKSVAVQYSTYGFKGKKNFSQLNVYKALTSKYDCTSIRTVLLLLYKGGLITNLLGPCSRQGSNILRGKVPM